MPYVFLSEDSFKRVKYAHISMQLFFEMMSERCAIEMKYRAMLSTFYDKYTNKIQAHLVLECSGVRVVFSEFLIECLRTANISRMVTDGIKGEDGPLMSIKLWIKRNEKENSGIDAKEEHKTAMLQFNDRLEQIQKYQLRYYNKRTTLEILDKTREKLVLKCLDKPHKEEKYERKIKVVETRKSLVKNEEEVCLDKYLSSLHHDVDHREGFESRMEEINNKFNSFEEDRIDTMIQSLKLYISHMKLLDTVREERVAQLDKIENLLAAMNVAQEIDDWNKSYLIKNEYPIFKEYDWSAATWHIDSDISSETDSDEEEDLGAKGGVSNQSLQEHYKRDPKTSSSSDRMDLFTPINLLQRASTSSEPDKKIPTAVTSAEKTDLFTPVNLCQRASTSSEPDKRVRTTVTSVDQMDLYKPANLRQRASNSLEPDEIISSPRSEQALFTRVYHRQRALSSSEHDKRTGIAATRPEQASLLTPVNLLQGNAQLLEPATTQASSIEPEEGATSSDPEKRARQRRRPLPVVPVKTSLPKLPAAQHDSESSDDERIPEPSIIPTSDSKTSTDSISDISLGKDIAVQDSNVKSSPVSNGDTTSSSEENVEHDDRTKIGMMYNVKVVAIVSHTALNDGELSFKTGKTIKQKRPVNDKGMAYGYIKKGKFNRKKYGYYPIDNVVLKVKSKTVKSSFWKKRKHVSEKYTDSGTTTQEAEASQGHGSWVDTSDIAETSMADNAARGTNEIKDKRRKSKKNPFRNMFKRK